EAHPGKSALSSMQEPVVYNVGGIPKSELIALAAPHRVASYSIGIDVHGRVVLWKLRYESGPIALFVLAQAVAIHFAKATRRAGRQLKWPVPADYPSDAPMITPTDWETAAGAFITVAYRAEA